MSRILVLSPIPPPADGIGWHSERLIETWLASGHEVAVMSTGSDHSAERSEGYEVHRLLSPAHRKRALELLETFDPDLVFCQFAVSALTVGVEVAFKVCRSARERGTPVAMAFHEPLREVSMLGPLGRPIYRHAASSCTIAITFSSIAATALRAAHAHVPIVQLPLGIPSVPPPSPEDRIRVRRRYHLEGSFVLDVGFIHPDKGVDVLVAAAPQIARLHGGPVDIVIAGRPRGRSLPFKLHGLIDQRYYASALRTARQDPGEARFSFPDYLPDEDLWPLLAEASAVVLPYRRTTQSGVAAFVLAAAAAAVVTTLPGLEGAFGNAAEYAAPENPGDLARAVHRVLDDPARQSELRTNARRRASAEGYGVVADGILHSGLESV